MAECGKIRWRRRRRILEKIKRIRRDYRAGRFRRQGVEGKNLRHKVLSGKQNSILGICYGMQLMVVEFARHIARKARIPRKSIQKLFTM